MLGKEYSLQHYEKRGVKSWILKIPGCNKVTAENTNEWVTGDGNESDLNDSHIAEIVLKPINDYEMVSIEPPVHLDYDEAFSALEKSFVFVEQQKRVSANLSHLK